MIPIFDSVKGAGALLGLGDLIAQPTASYSLRYLSIGYYGQPVVKVRKDIVGNPTQDFTPSQLTGGELSTFADGNDCYVSTWYDQSGNGYHASQGAAASQPKIWDAITGLVTEGGRPALDFDGVDDNLATTGYIVELSANDASVFAVISAINSKYILAEGDSVSPYSSNFIFGDANGVSVIWVNTTQFGTTITGHSLVGFIYDGTNFQAYQDGLADGASGTATVNAEVFNQSVIGARADGTTSFYTGKIQELITYKSDQSANRTDIENNINAYYDIYP